MEEQREWLRLLEGDNRIRILTDPVMDLIHWVPHPENNVGRRLQCEGPECCMCSNGLRQNTRYQFQVLDCNDENKEKTLDIGIMIFNALDKYWEDPDYGPESKYNNDWRIRKTGSGINVRYNVLPCLASRQSQLQPVPKPRTIGRPEITVADYDGPVTIHRIRRAVQFLKQENNFEPETVSDMKSSLYVNVLRSIADGRCKAVHDCSRAASNVDSMFDKSE